MEIKINQARDNPCGDDFRGRAEDRTDRRRVLAAGLGAVAASILAVGTRPASAANSQNPDEGVTAPEDLMKEHGVLNRCLLIYEEGIRRVQAKEEVAPAVFHHTADLIRRFVEEYHEKNEEKYIFPVFQKADRLTDLVQTLLTQHKAGRAVTNQIIRLSTPDVFRVTENQQKVIAAAQSFIRMYRPHESREDTVLFPALRSILTPKQVEVLGERMEEDEHKVLGDEGFEKAVAEVASIEKALGIHDLNQFTPKVT
jgi:hemerythrin-like domain-containing protein